MRARALLDGESAELLPRRARRLGSWGGGCGCCPPTVPADRAPHWLLRPHILKGYRVDLSPLQCFVSLFTLHNESGNIWTHLVPCVVMGRLAWQVIVTGEWSVLDVPGASLSPVLETLAVGSFLAMATLTFFFSSFYHLANCTSESTCALLLRLDVTGIALLISASFLPGVYYGFACFPHLQHIYLACILVMLVSGLLAANLGPIHDERVARFRNLVFVLSVAFGFLV